MITTALSRGLVLLLLTVSLGAAPASGAVDVCVYGGTAGGVAAAVQVRRMGKTALLIEPSQHLGGLTSGGLGATDIGNKAAIGGIAREFYQKVAQHYAQDSAWSQETRAEYFQRRSSSQTQATDLGAAGATMWTFEPHVAEEILGRMAHTADVPIVFGQRLAAVRMEGGHIEALVLENGQTLRARMFVDASYEGDLLAQAKVKFTIGREANSTYDETLNGVRPETPKHQFVVSVDPYRRPGDRQSGLLPFVQAEPLGTPGAGDRSVQAYNFRLCFTTNAANRLPIPAPANYNPADYELLARYLEALVAAGKHPVLSEFWNPIWMPNQKTDINNNGGFSTDFIGANGAYPEADWPTRTKIWQQHKDYTLGFLTFLATSPRVPANIRGEMAHWGPAKDEFTDTGGWPRQLYVREARRMVSDYVMTEQNCRGTRRAEDAVGLGAYNMDSHNCRRLAREGHAENEGDVQVSVRPYPISYRSIVPKAGECDNLLVPICLSATHIAYGSIRMEPVFMILGQSAATAACLALEASSSVQQVTYVKLKERLARDRQVLEWLP
ncbi:MAG: FAD-dependent oxidoreductase [Verrucomicrobiota bacterium]